MARIYSYEIIYKSHHTESLLNDFKKILISKSAAKLALNEKWKPEETYINEDKKIQTGIKGIREEYDSKNSYCFSLAFPKESSIDKLQAKK